MLGRFVHLVGSRDDLALAYATGRSYKLAMEGILEHGLPLPDSLICEVGSEVYHRSGEALASDTEYEALMESILGASVRQRVPEFLEGVKDTYLQEAEKQGRFKVSFYVEPDVIEADLLIRVRESLRHLRNRVNVVFSVDPVDRRGLLDIMPAGVSKASAAHYLRARLDLEPESVVYAGDSGNDTDALLAGFNAILVGNAPDPIRARLQEEFRSRGREDRLHCARAPYLSGVLEGCERFGLS